MMGSKKKKVIAAAVVAVFLLALGVAGTFAASSSADSNNNISGEIDMGLVLHDDSSSILSFPKNRDIYVENTGKVSLYVRMRLNEFMRYGKKSLIAGGVQADLSTWKPHAPYRNRVADCGTEIHDYFELVMGNTTPVDYASGVRNWYEAANGVVRDKQTPVAKVITMAAYTSAAVKPKDCWVLDTDGYAYWYTQLEGDSATGLLLNQIEDTGLIDASYFYGINAVAEAVTEFDLNSWLHGTVPTDGTDAANKASAQAAVMLKNISPKYILITAEMNATNPKASEFDDDNDGFLTKKEYASYQSETGITPQP